MNYSGLEQSYSTPEQKKIPYFYDNVFVQFN